MFTQGPKNGGTFSTGSSFGGTYDWTNVSNVQTYNASYATSFVEFLFNTTYEIRVTNCGFTIPSNGVIRGISAEISCYKDIASSTVISYAYATIMSGSTIGNNLASNNAIPTSDDGTYVTLGDAFGLSGLGYTPADINGTDFGVYIAFTSNDTDGVTIYVNHIRVTVYYDQPSVLLNTPVTNGNTFASNSIFSGSAPWTNTSNAQLYDGNYANADTDLIMNNTTESLFATDFKFSIPADATIVGIKVEVNRYNEQTAGLGDLTDLLCRLTIGMVQYGDDKATNTAIPTSDDGTYKTYGGLGDDWNAGLVPTDVNSSDFGFAYQLTMNGGITCTGHVNHIRVTIAYLAFDTSSVVTQQSDIGALISQPSL